MALTQQELEQLAAKTVALYNRLRSPEVTVKLLSVSLLRITASFSGGFCYGCGVQDYVEGFTGQFKALNGKAELKVGKTRQITPRNFEAEFTVKNK